MKRIVKRDRVVVVSGRYKGSVGVVLEVFPEENRLVVEGVNRVRRAVKNSDSGNYREKEASIHISNVALVDPKTEKAVKVGFRKEGNKKVRFNRKTGEVLERP